MILHDLSSVLVVASLNSTKKVENPYYFISTILKQMKIKKLVLETFNVIFEYFISKIFFPNYFFFIFYYYIKSTKFSTQHCFLLLLTTYIRLSNSCINLYHGNHNKKNKHY